MSTVDKRENLGNQIWNSVKTELLFSMRFMAPALSVLEIKRDMSTTSVGTDAVSVLYNPNYIYKTYVEDPSMLNRTYLHMLMHCMFRHMYEADKFSDTELWDLACDIAVESIIDSLRFRSVRTGVSRLRMNWCTSLVKK